MHDKSLNIDCDQDPRVDRKRTSNSLFNSSFLCKEPARHRPTRCREPAPCLYVKSYELVSRKREYPSIANRFTRTTLVVKDTIESTYQRVDFDGDGRTVFFFFS